MERVRRFKIAIVATIACAVMLIAAAFSVSLAAWESGDSVVYAQGSVGSYYVEYPRYAQSSGSVQLDADTYYIQTVQKNNAQEVVSYSYYPMSLSGKDSDGRDQYTVQLQLTENENAYLYKGEEPLTDVYKDWGLQESDGAFADGVFTAAKTARYVFCFKEGTESVTSEERYAYDGSFTLTFKEGKTYNIYPKVDGATASQVYLWMWTPSTNYTGGKWPGVQLAEIFSGSYSSYVNTTNLLDFTEVDPSDLNVIISYNATDPRPSSDNPSRQTATFNFTNVFDVEGDNYKTITASSSAVPTVANTPKTTVTTGNTDSHLYAGVATSTVATPTPIVQSTADDFPVTTVRRFTGTTSKTDDGDFSYHNYICVSRRNHVGDNDNSICFIEFVIDGENLDNVPVKSIEITRSQTDENGTPTGGKIDPAPRLYNYDPTAVTMLSDIGHGGLQSKDSGSHMVEHYTDGMYCILFFADNDQQYFALDIKIVTTVEATFTLTANASNVNHWQRYESGYGEPWGFYMGGLINNVWLWDPRRTTKMNIESGAVEINPDGTPKEGTYNTVTFDGKQVKYPSGTIDLTLTVNLVGNSLVKMYMLDQTGHRLDGDTVYLLPNDVVCTPSAMFSGVNMFDKDLNLKIPVSGEYSFRLVGKVHLREEAVNGKSGTFMSMVDGSRASSELNSNYIGIPNFNLVVDKLYISRSDGNASNPVTFNAGEGVFEDGNNTLTQYVRFGNNLVEPAAPTHHDSSKIFGGWYTDAACTVEFDFNSPVTDELTLFAKWVGREYTVSFNANGGTFGSSALYTVTTGTDGKIASADLPTEPQRSGYVFDGWFTLATGGEKVEVTASYVFDSNVTLYAQWTEVQDPNASHDYTTVTSSNGYVVGQFAARNMTGFVWGSGYKMTLNGSEYQIKRLYLEVGDEFKIRAGDYYSSGCNDIRGATGISNTSDYLTSSGTSNVTVKKTGYYDFYVSNGQNIWFAYSAS